jgi:hypothetical protein
MAVFYREFAGQVNGNKMLCLLFCLVGVGIVWVYPFSQTYASLKDKQYSKQWLSYWLVLGLISFLEQTLLSFLAGFFLFETLKVLFALWLVHPNFKGAEYLAEEFFDGAFEVVKSALKPTPVGKFLGLDDNADD